MGIQVLPSPLGPGLAFTLAEQTSNHVGERNEQSDFQHERPPWEKIENIQGKAGLATTYRRSARFNCIR